MTHRRAYLLLLLLVGVGLFARPSPAVGWYDLNLSEWTPHSQYYDWKPFFAGGFEDYRISTVIENHTGLTWQHAVECRWHREEGSYFDNVQIVVQDTRREEILRVSCAESPGETLQFFSTYSYELHFQIRADDVYLDPDSLGSAPGLDYILWKSREFDTDIPNFTPTATRTREPSVTPSHTPQPTPDPQCFTHVVEPGESLPIETGIQAMQAWRMQASDPVAVADAENTPLGRLPLWDPGGDTPGMVLEVDTAYQLSTVENRPTQAYFCNLPLTTPTPTATPDVTDPLAGCFVLTPQVVDVSWDTDDALVYIPPDVLTPQAQFEEFSATAPIWIPITAVDNWTVQFLDGTGDVMPDYAWATIGNRIDQYQPHVLYAHTQTYTTLLAKHQGQQARLCPPPEPPTEPPPTACLAGVIPDGEALISWDDAPYTVVDWGAVRAGLPSSSRYHLASILDAIARPEGAFDAWLYADVAGWELSSGGGRVAVHQNWHRGSPDEVVARSDGPEEVGRIADTTEVISIVGEPGTAWTLCPAGAPTPTTAPPTTTASPQATVPPPTTAASPQATVPLETPTDTVLPTSTPDVRPVLVRFDSTDYTVSERHNGPSLGGGFFVAHAQLVVELSRAHYAPVAVRYRTRSVPNSSGNARPGNDYANPGDDYFETVSTVHFAIGQTSAIIDDIPIIDDDLIEGTEYFAVELFYAGEGAELDQYPVAAVRILDDEAVSTATPTIEPPWDTTAIAQRETIIAGVLATPRPTETPPPSATATATATATETATPTVRPRPYAPPALPACVVLSSHYVQGYYYAAWQSALLVSPGGTPLGAVGVTVDPDDSRYAQNNFNRFSFRALAPVGGAVLPELDAEMLLFGGGVRRVVLMRGTNQQLTGDTDRLAIRSLSPFRVQVCPPGYEAATPVVTPTPQPPTTTATATATSATATATATSATATATATGTTTATPEPDLPLVRFDSTMYTAHETEAAVALLVELSRASTEPVRVTFTTENGSALAGEDYTGLRDTITFLPGELAKTIVIPLLDDQVGEPAELFGVLLEYATGALLDRFPVSAVQLLDNDPAAGFTPVPTRTPGPGCYQERIYAPYTLITLTDAREVTTSDIFAVYLSPAEGGNILSLGYVATPFLGTVVPPGKYVAVPLDIGTALEMLADDLLPKRLTEIALNIDLSVPLQLCPVLPATATAAVPTTVPTLDGTPFVCVPEATSRPDSGPQPDVALVMPTLRPLPTLVTNTLVLSDSLVVAARTAMVAWQQPVETALAASAGRWASGGGDAWAAGAADAAVLTTGLRELLGWLALFGMVGPALGWLLPPVGVRLVVLIARAGLSLTLYVRSMTR